MRRLVSAATAGAATLATLTLVAGPASADPMVSDDNVSVRAGDYGQFSVADNDNGPAKLKVTSNPGAGWAYFGDDLVLTYVAPRSFSGTVTLEYAAFDPDVADDENDPAAGQIGAPATVTIEVSPIGELTAVDDIVHAFVGETVDVDLGGNDTNSGSADYYTVGNDGLSSTLGSLYLGGGGRGQMTGTDVGEETIDYQVVDGLTGAEIGHGSVTITVEARNVTLVADSGSVPANEELVVDVLGNDLGILPGDTVEVSSPVRGDYAWFDDEQRKVVYSSSTVGSDTFTYTVHGADGTDLGTKTVSVTVTAALKVSAHNDDYDAEKDTPNLLPVTDNDRSDDPVTASIVDAPSHGTASVVRLDDYNAQIRYTPDSGYVGPDSLTYQLDDHKGHTSTATVALRVKQVGVQNLGASVAWQGAHLRWTNPHATTFTGVVVRMNVGATSDDYPEAPATPADGLEVSVPAGASTVDVGSLVNGNHYAFSVFAEYGAGVYSEPKTTDVTPGVEPLVNLHSDGGNATATLAWTNPTGLDSVSLTYSADNFTTQREVVVPTGATTVKVTGLRNGTVYDFQAVSHGGGTDSEVAYTTARPRATNVKPTAVADTVSLNGAEPVTFWADTNDSDPNGDALSVISTTQPAHGSVSCDAVLELHLHARVRHGPGGDRHVQLHGLRRSRRSLRGCRHAGPQALRGQRRHRGGHVRRLQPVRRPRQRHRLPGRRPARRRLLRLHPRLDRHRLRRRRAAARGVRAERHGGQPGRGLHALRRERRAPRARRPHGERHARAVRHDDGEQPGLVGQRRRHVLGSHDSGPGRRADPAGAVLLGCRGAWCSPRRSLRSPPRRT